MLAPRSALSPGGRHRIRATAADRLRVRRTLQRRRMRSPVLDGGGGRARNRRGGVAPGVVGRSLALERRLRVQCVDLGWGAGGSVVVVSLLVDAWSRRQVDEVHEFVEREVADGAVFVVVSLLPDAWRKRQEVHEDVEWKVAAGVWFFLVSLLLDERGERRDVDGEALVLESLSLLREQSVERHGGARVGRWWVGGAAVVLLLLDEDVEESRHVLQQLVHEIDKPRVASESVERRRGSARVDLWGAADGAGVVLESLALLLDEDVEWHGALTGPLDHPVVGGRFDASCLRTVSRRADRGCVDD